MEKETRTDYAGTYTAYIYDDGHVETDPPGRPLYREDIQRQRLQQEARKRATDMLQAQRARSGVSGTLESIKRENAAAILPRTLVSSVHETLDAVAAMMRTFRTNAHTLENASLSYSLGAVQEESQS